jgi:hypothetical protein
MIGKEFFNHFFFPTKSFAIFLTSSVISYFDVPVCMMAFWHFCWFMQASLPVLDVFFLWDVRFSFT